MLDHFPKLNFTYIERLYTYWLSGRAGRENIWPEVMAFGPSAARSVRYDRGPNISRPARPNSVNTHFIIWPPRFSFFFFFPGNKICYGNVHSRHSFWPKSRDLYSNKVFSVRISQRAVRYPGRAGRLFPALLAPSRTALIRGFSQWFRNESTRGAVRVIW